MAYTMTRSYENYGDSTALAGELEALAGDLEAMSGKFSSALSTIDSLRGGINFGDWDNDTLYAEDSVEAIANLLNVI